MRTVAGVLIVSLAAAACSPVTPTGGEPAVELENGDTGAQPDGLPETDFSQHTVPLEDIHFDTFGGGAVPLSEATPELIEELRDAIPPIDRPVYVGADEIAPDILVDDDLVLGYVAPDGRARAYPLKILNFHEIVNEEFDGVPVLISYCPLCRSAVVYDRRLDGRTLTFGNTSALYENDLVMFDRETNSYWWQVAGRAIVGELSGEGLTPLPSSTTTWADWRARHPDTLVLSTDTGFERPYARDAFTGYRQAVRQGNFPFPLSEEVRNDQRLDPSEEVVGILIEGEARAYAVRQLGDGVANDELAGVPLVVLSSADGPTGAVFRRTVDGRDLTFRFEDGRYLDEETASVWSLDGRAVEGPLAGTELEPVAGRFSFWFAFVASFPEATVFVPE